MVTWNVGLLVANTVERVMTWGDLFDETDHLEVTIGAVRDALCDRREDADA